MEFLSPNWVEEEEREKAFHELREQMEDRDNWRITCDMIQSHIQHKKKT